MEAIDTVSLGNGITVSSQSIGAASFSLGLGGFDGILGLGPVDLTKGTVVSVDSIITQTWSNRTVPTFTNNLVSEGVISQDIVGAYFQPLHGSNASEADGEITFGGFDSSKFTGDLTYFPRLTSGNLSAYWSIAVEEVKYGTVAIGTGLTAMVDTGTDVILLPTSVFSAFMKTSGGFNDRINNIAVFSTKPTSNFEITLGQTTYTLTPDQYLLPMAQYSNFGLDTDKYYAWFADSGSSTFILGQKFLEYYYSVYDTSNSRVGLAKAV